MDIKQQTQNVANQGRYGDSMLLHVNPAEVKGLAQAMPITVNPQTGQPEAFLPFLAPILGSMAGTSLLAGAGGLLAGKTALAAGIGAGLATYAQTGGSGSKALLSGLTAGFGANAANTAAATTAGTTAGTEAATKAATQGLDFAGQKAASQAANTAAQAAYQPQNTFSAIGDTFAGGFDQGAKSLATGLMSPSGMVAGTALGARGVINSQELFEEQMRQMEMDEEQRRRDMYANNPEVQLYSAAGGMTQFQGGGLLEQTLSGDYGILGMLNNNPELMFGAAGIAAKNNFRGSLLGELYNSYKKRKDAGDEQGANEVASQIQQQEANQMAYGGITQFNRGGSTDKDQYGYEAGKQVYAPAKAQYDLNPNFMAGFAPETMYFRPDTLNAPSMSTRGGSRPTLGADTYTGSKGGYGGRQASIAPQTTIDPYSAYTGQPPAGLEFTNTPIPMPIQPMPELPVPPILPPDFDPIIGIPRMPGIFNLDDFRAEYAKTNPTPPGGGKAAGAKRRAAYEVDLMNAFDDYQNVSTVPQLMTAPPIEYTNMPSNNAFGITGEDLGITQPSNLGLGDMMTAETLMARGITPQPTGSGIFGKGPIIEPDLLMEDQSYMFEPPIRERKTGGDTLKPIPEDNKGLPNLPKDVRNEMGYMQEGGMTDMQSDPLTREVTMFILGESDDQQVVNQFVDKYGVEAFTQLREEILQSLVPNAQTSGLIEGVGNGGMDDDIMGTIGNKEKIAVSQDEFIVPADVVSMLGDGSSDAGSKELYDMMDRVRQKKTGTTKQAPKLANAGGLLPA
jgi:hypothetical protein